MGANSAQCKERALQRHALPRLARPTAKPRAYHSSACEIAHEYGCCRSRPRLPCGCQCSTWWAADGQSSCGSALRPETGAHRRRHQNLRQDCLPGYLTRHLRHEASAQGLETAQTTSKRRGRANVSNRRTCAHTHDQNVMYQLPARACTNQLC